MFGSRAIRIGRLAGIPIGIHPLWLVIVGLITWGLGRTYYPEQVDGISAGAAYALGLASAMLLFASILAHEVGHAVVARRRGVEIREIDLWLLGGVASMQGEPQRAEDELRFALAGPAVTAVVAAFFGLLRLALGGVDAPALIALVEYQAFVNTAILVFNMLPAFPLDGGRVARALLWRRLGDKMRATAIAADLGHTFGWVLVALGFLSFLAGAIGGIWLALIGGFLILASRAELQQSIYHRVLEGRPVGDLVAHPAVVVPAAARLDEVVERWFTPHLHASFPVVGADGAVTGLLTLERVRSIPAVQRPQLTAADVADPDPQLLVPADMPIEDVLQRPSFLRARRAIVVDDAGRALGVVAVADVERLVAVLALAQEQRAGRPGAAS